MLDEVADLFPGPYIHVGGDEAVKDQWKASSRVQARMHALGLENENALQGWFVGEIARHLATRGKRVVGWDEILDRRRTARRDRHVLARHEGRHRSRARRPRRRDGARSPDLYLDHLQSDAPDEPPGRPSLRTLADIYAFDPVAPDMTPEVASRVLGAEAALWTEHMRTEERVEHAAFPRLDALAEVLWSPKSAREWNGFVARLGPEILRQRTLGIHLADIADNARTPEYMFKSALTRKSSELKPCSGKLRLRLEDDAPAEGPRAIFDVDLFDPCWLFEHAPLDGIGGVAIDVGQIPYNFELAHDINGIVPRPLPASPSGELLVKLDGCKGTTIATIPLVRPRGIRQSRLCRRRGRPSTARMICASSSLTAATIRCGRSTASASFRARAEPARRGRLRLP